MLTTAVGLVSIGAEPANLHPVSSEQNSTENSPFSNAFDEKVASADETQPKIVDDTPLQNTKDGKSSAPAQTPRLLVVAAGAKKSMNIQMKDEPRGTVSALDSKGQDTKGPAPLLPGSKGAASAAVEIPQESESKPSAVAASKALVSVLLNISPDVSERYLPDEVVPATGQKSSAVNADVSQTDVSDGTAVSATDASTLKKLLLPGQGQKLATSDQKDLEIADPSTSTKIVVKESEDAGKTGRPSKSEKKDGKAAAAAGNASGIEAQIQMTIAVPMIAASSDGQSTKTSGAAKDAAPTPPASSSAITLGQGGRVAAAGEHNGKVPISPAKTDAVGVKDAAATVPGDPASLKAAPDSAKSETHSSGSATGTDPKGQRDVAAVSPLAAAHPEGALAGAVAGVTEGITAAHALVSKPQLEATASSAATMQAGTSAGTGTFGGAQVDAAPRTLSASPTALEVGVPNGTHGWLKIRAEMTSGGVVDASLSTSSSSGQEMLHRELPSLTTYLQNEHVAVNTVVVQPSGGAGAGFPGLAGGMNHDGRGQAQSGSQGGESRQETASAVLNHTESARSYLSVPGIGGDDLLLPASYAGGGSWLSVRA